MRNLKEMVNKKKITSERITLFHRLAENPNFTNVVMKYNIL